MIRLSASLTPRVLQDPKGKGPSSDVNMVFMLPMEFLAPSGDDEELDFSDQIAQLALMEELMASR